MCVAVTILELHVLREEEVKILEIFKRRVR